LGGLSPWDIKQLIIRRKHDSAHDLQILVKCNQCARGDPRDIGMQVGEFTGNIKERAQDEDKTVNGIRYI
jgi:hypothetical protein